MSLLYEGGLQVVVEVWRDTQGGCFSSGQGENSMVHPPVCLSLPRHYNLNVSIPSKSFLTYSAFPIWLLVFKLNDTPPTPGIFGIKKARNLNRNFELVCFIEQAARSLMDKHKILDLMSFLDVCQHYFQIRKNDCRDLYTLWAIVRFVRDEDSSEFLRWCHCCNIKHLREYDNEGEIKRRTSLPRAKEQTRIEKRIIKILQDLFYCGCIPNDLDI